jgi:hypothetical protein
MNELEITIMDYKSKLDFQSNYIDAVIALNYSI